MELALAKSLLEAAEIPFYVHNEHFGGLYAGPQMEYFNARMIMVAPEFEAAAREVLADFILQQQIQAEAVAAETEKTSFWDKLRMVTEVLLFSWIMPGKRPSKKDKTTPKDR